MIEMSQAGEIRRMYFVQGLTIKEICERLGVSRNTVRAEVRGERSLENRYRERKPVAVKLGPYMGVLDAMIEANEKLPRRQRRTALKLYEELKGQGYEGAYNSVHRRVKRWRQEQGLVIKEAYVPLVFRPGEAVQFDFSEQMVDVDGVPTMVKAAHMTLCYSRLSLTQVFALERQEMMLEGMKRGFAFFEGVTRRITVDNLKAAVLKVLRGKERIWTESFEGLCRLYLVEPDACEPGKGNQKGRVERRIQTERHGLFSPMLKGKSLEEINDQLLSLSLGYAKQTKHPEVPQRTIWEVFSEEEKPQLMALPPQPYECCVVEEEKLVDKSCTVAFDANRYSAPCQFVGYRVQVRAYAFEVKIFHRGKLLATHQRSFQKGTVVFNPLHYLDVLEKKPQTLNNGKPFVNWELPPVFATARQMLANKHRKRAGEGDKAFIQVLLLLREHPLAEVTAALELAVDQGSPNVAVVRNLLSRLLDPTPATTVLALPQGITLSREPVADPQVYDIHLREGKDA